MSVAFFVFSVFVLDDDVSRNVRTARLSLTGCIASACYVAAPAEQQRRPTKCTRLVRKRFDKAGTCSVPCGCSEQACCR